VSLLSLAREDREILHDLLVQCRQAEQSLKGRSAEFAAGWVVAVSVGLSLFSAILFWASLIR
jgi:hypothetical protein